MHEPTERCFDMLHDDLMLGWLGARREGRESLYFRRAEVAFRALHTHWYEHGTRPRLGEHAERASDPIEAAYFDAAEFGQRWVNFRRQGEWTRSRDLVSAADLPAYEKKLGEIAHACWASLRSYDAAQAREDRASI